MEVEIQGEMDVVSAAKRESDSNNDDDDYGQEPTFPDGDVSFRFSHYGLPRWKHLPHFHYRRLLHHYFSGLHFYHPKFLPRGSTLAAAANVASATIGVGTLAMPYAAYSCGWGLFSLFALLTLLATLWTIYVVCVLVDIHSLHSFEMLTRTVFNSERLEVFVEGVIVFNALGSAVAYIVVIGDIAHSLTSTFGGGVSPEVVRLVAQVVAYLVALQPLSLLRTVGALKIASVVGIAAITVLVVFVTSQGLAFGTASNLRPLANSSPVSVLVGIPLLFFAFNNQINAIEIYSEMQPRSPGRFACVCLGAVGSVAIAFFLVAFCGLSLFGPSIQGNVLKNFDASNPFAMLALLGVGLKVVLTFPLIMFPCREALLHFMGVEDVHHTKPTLFLAVSVVLPSTCLVIAVFVPGVTTMFGLIGSLCAGLFGFILPAGLALSEPKYWERLGAVESVLHRIVNWIILGIGFCVAIVGTAVSL